ncbi:MAG: UDP-N-acetylglucosamine--N-acetylmuramyl-(pentapeptide) pyrophosphoryl-undecaprenol [Sphaerochaeta sp.]|nr:UDP-N-acetylglucosamine--N-acetylmuramyl-(pentapeptide) pyrophosphoryl-undecaprenol [Sphaerochaeta sp.]
MGIDGTILPMVYQIDTIILEQLLLLCYSEAMVVCYTGGGTLGHIFPALAVHEELACSPDYQAFWIGREEASEKEVVGRYGIPFFAIRWGKLRRYWSLRNFLDIGNIIIAFFQALHILRVQKPDVIFSKGGFVSVPPVLAAAVLHIPVVSHESDATPGLATRINAKYSQCICVPFHEGFTALKKYNLVVTGNPIRRSLVLASQQESMQRPAFLGLSEPLILVLGGSSGSAQINLLVRETLASLTEMGYVYHQCGANDVQHLVHDRYQEVSFIDEALPLLLKNATVVVSRAGANTLAELALFGCPSLLIPLGGASSRGDQIDNARLFERKEAAMVLYPDTLDAKQFLESVSLLVGDEEFRERLRGNMKKLAYGTSAHHIATVLKTVKESTCNGV